MAFRLPTIHLNGSSPVTLYREYAQARDAIQAARVALASATLHRRDFYPQDPWAWEQAEIERRETLLKLEEAEDYCDQWCAHIYERMPERDRATIHHTQTAPCAARS